MEQILGNMLSGQIEENEIIDMFTKMESDTFTTEDIIGGAKAMREAMVPVLLPGNPFDTCGTGGSGKKTINTSTLVAFIVATAGVEVAKHGNRSASGNCGSFDVLEALGAEIDLTVEQEQELYYELGIVFLFAKNHHPAMRHVASARKMFGKKTIFNVLGPLCNPAGVTKQMVGVSKKEHMSIMAQALRELGCTSGTVVIGDDGLDEITVCSTTQCLSVPEMEASVISPKDVGLELALPELIEGGDASRNMDLLVSIASGNDESAHTNLVLINAAKALEITGKADNILEGYTIAKEIVSSGDTLRLIQKYVTASNDISTSK